MAHLRCPHCATSTTIANVAEAELCGCPTCGGVFVAAADSSSLQTKSTTQRPSAEQDRPCLPTSKTPSALFYPPSPTRVPPDLTEPNESYRRGVVLLFVTMCLFFALYLGLVIGSGCMIFWSIRWLALLGLPFSFLFLILFLYLLKGFFKSQDQGKSFHIEISAEEQPRLFAFIRRLCREVEAPEPYRVFLSPEVNAAAFYEHSVLDLFRPAPKNLVLGLGLVNVLTLSEFKAVLAHEFGHFAQSSMKLGAYVYAFNRVLVEVVAGRDWLDNFLLALRRQPSVVGFFGTVCWVLVRGLRRATIGLFYAINFLDKSLSRQMEFHADLVSVQACGSEAIVRALARLEFANESLEAALGELKLAADHKRYSRDLFVHHRDAIEHLRKQRQNPQLGEPPPLTDDPLLAPEVFDPEDGPPPMWADHPSNYDREQNAKRRYVSCPLDDRPAWLLFDDADDARERVTRRFYRVALKIPRDAELEEAETIQSFLQEERRAVTFDPRYHGMYDERFIEPGDIKELIALDCFELLKPAVLRQRYAALYGETVEAQAAAYRRHREERDLVLTYRREYNPKKKKPLEFRGRRYGLGDIKNLLRFLDEQQEKDRRLLAKEDRAVFVVHYQMASYLGEPTMQALRERYGFHLILQKLLANLFGGQEELESALAFLAEEGDRDLSPQTFGELYRLFRGVRDTLRQTLETADELRLPPLPHLKTGARLGSILWDRPLVGRLGSSGQSISLRKIQKLREQLGEVIDRLRHVHFKHLRSLLKIQEEISRRWLARKEDDFEE